jgi:hypothetical protein
LSASCTNTHSHSGGGCVRHSPFCIRAAPLSHFGIRQVPRLRAD